MYLPKKDKIAIICISLFICIIFVLLNIQFDTLCAEDNYCRQGSTKYINNTKIIVSENTCLENNGVWISSKKRCDFKND